MTQLILLLHIFLREIETYVAQNREQPKCPSADEWMNKMWYSHTMEWKPFIKRKKLLMCSSNTMWISLKNLTKKADTEDFILYDSI